MYLTHTPSFIKFLFGRATWSSEDNESLYLTFDDGPHPDSTPTLLAILDRLKIKATFFCLGEQIRLYPNLFKEIKAAGHTIGNHGYSHLSGWTSSMITYMDNVQKGAAYSESLLFRPPYGRLSYRQYIKLNEYYKIIMWSCMPGDFDLKNNGEDLYSIMSKTDNKKDIIVLHDRPSTIEKLHYALNLLYQNKDS